MGTSRSKRGKEPVQPGWEGKSKALHPRKRMFRARAHCNPLNDSVLPAPTHPDDMDWSEHFPAVQAAHKSGADTPLVRFADVGCGFGGLLIKLSPLYPDTLMLGMEIRDKVCAYVRERIASLRLEHPGSYVNVSVLRTNAQRSLPHYFRKHQLTKMFFLFPDPHFKVANHRRRIVTPQLLSEYAYFLAPGGLLYTITDVQELGHWMRSKLAAHPLFEEVGEAELAADPAAQLLPRASEEAQKVARNEGQTFRAVFRRLLSPST